VAGQYCGCEIPCSRYVAVEEARKDRYDREAIVQSLRDQRKRGDNSLVGNKGYRRFLKKSDSHFEIDEDKITDERIAVLMFAGTAPNEYIINRRRSVKGQRKR
jgi:hypothetical protein